MRALSFDHIKGNFLIKIFKKSHPGLNHRSAFHYHRATRAVYVENSHIWIDPPLLKTKLKQNLHLLTTAAGGIKPGSRPSLNCNVPTCYQSWKVFQPFSNLAQYPRKGVPGAPADFLLTDGWDGWDGMDGMVGPLFFFGPYLENYFIIFHNFFSSLKYMFLKFYLEYSQKKKCHPRMVILKSKKKFPRQIFPVNKKSAGAPGTPLRKWKDNITTYQ